MIFDRLLFPAPKQKAADPIAAMLRGSNSSTGVNVTPERALTYATVFSIVRVLAESVGQLPCVLMERDAGGNTVGKATKHPLFPLLHDAPNDFQTSQEFFEHLVAHLALRGNFYGWKNVVGGSVREVLPLSPDAVEPKLQPDGATVLYKVRFADGSTDVLDAREIFHVKIFSLDGVVGVSPIRYQRETVGVALATAEHGARFFSNGARPGGVLATDQVLSDESYKHVRESWEETHKGMENAHRIAILEAGLKWSQVSVSNEDAQWIESQKFSRSQLAAIWRVPPHKIGDLERATFSNIDSQAIDFVVGTLVPYVRRIEQRIAISLLTPEERARYFAKFNVGGLLRGEPKTRAELYQSAILHGWLSPNEVRDLEEYPPREGGDVYLTPANSLHDGKLASGVTPVEAKKEATIRALARGE